MSLNLSRKPFVNRRPVRRAGYLLWTLGFVLAVVNGFLYWNHLSGQGVTETGLQDVIGQLQEESELLARAQEQLAGFETAELNRKIEFVNLRIQQRTFSWSQLFDVLAATLPDDVRLSSLSPKFEDAARRGRRGAVGLRSDEVRLGIHGEAKSSEALLEFLDRLFAHVAFDDPDLHREQVRPDDQVIDFSISTNYLPTAVASTAANGDETEEVSE